jgi:putative ABC transport system permease protein
MIRFILKGIIRDRSRSLFPIIIVAAGVMLTVLLHAWLNGVLNDMIDSSARFSTGHVKVVTRAWAEEPDQMPNDAALMPVDSLFAALQQNHPEMNWMRRIRFGGLLDMPDENGETRSQGPVIGYGVNLINPGSVANAVLGPENALIRGNMPARAGEILVSEKMAQRLGIKPGDRATLISSSMFGSMAVYNFTVSGTVSFGMMAIDRGAILVDLDDIRQALDMQDACSEILGYFPQNLYDEPSAEKLCAHFNSAGGGDFSPVMLTLSGQEGLGEMLAFYGQYRTVVVFAFLFVMSIVLWNTGLMGSIRRYGEIGLRLAVGEARGKLYRSLLYEALLIGVIGSVAGTAAGLLLAWYLQVHGIDISGMMPNSNMMMSNIMRARIIPATWLVGFIPGVLATTIGSALSGLAVFRRNTSQLFKELET